MATGATIDARPPQSYSFITATAVSARAIDLYHHRSLDAETRDRLARARRWLAGQQPLCTEERTYQLLGLLWTGADPADRKRLTGELLAEQRKDGGWNSVNGRRSDAYSTAEALVALQDAGGVPTSDARWQRGLRYLIRTQASDGSWYIRSRLMPPVQMSPPYFDTGYPHRHDGFISIMGAAWVLRAMARALGPASPQPVPVLGEAEPAAEPWMETVLFGSAADVRNLPGSTWNPNAATPKGTTALMMAVPDIEKLRDLIDRGADINARSKSRYSALLVAALYPDGDAAANLLLARGARTRLPKGQGAPLFNATGMALAANNGNSRLIPIFAAQGENATDKYTYVGLFPGTPAVAAAQMDDTATMRAMLDSGLAVDTADGDGLTLLDWAVICNRPNATRLLIAHGADVNHVDRFGMTPLQHAASIDFGHAEVIDILRKAGARLEFRTKKGLTARDLARKYGHTNLLHSLGEM